MGEPTAGQVPVVIEVETERVEGVVDLEDVVGIVRALRDEAVRAPDPQVAFRPGPVARRPSVGPAPGAGRTVRGDAGAIPDAPQRLERIGRLADELADQLAELARLQRPGG